MIQLGVTIILAVLSQTAVQPEQARAILPWNPRLRLYQDGDFWEWVDNSEFKMRSRLQMQLLEQRNGTRTLRATHLIYGPKTRGTETDISQDTNTREVRAVRSRSFLREPRGSEPDETEAWQKQNGPLLPGTFGNSTNFSGCLSFSGTDFKFLQDTTVRMAKDLGEIRVKVYKGSGPRSIYYVYWCPSLGAPFCDIIEYGADEAQKMGLPRYWKNTLTETNVGRFWENR